MQGMLLTVAELPSYLRVADKLLGEPDIARVPIMIDSSKWEVIEATRWIKAQMPGAKVSGGVSGRLALSLAAVLAARRRSAPMPSRCGP